MMDHKLMGLSLILALVMVNGAIEIPNINDSVAFLENEDTVLSYGDVLKNGEYTLRLENDCNLVLLKKDGVIWSSDTHRSYQTCFLKFQEDANLVIYNGQYISQWASATNRKYGNYILALTKSGNLAIYGPRIWETKTGKLDGGDFKDHKVRRGSGMTDGDDGAFVVISGQDREKVIKRA